ncbi:hypothetical protein LNP09_01615 [Apilactobacillus kunkeei]|nr:hypothetical protein [Apilactobacillus kunkeei]MCK8619668.1 hypothetical protein [Apilactobacillus kunkeei]
MIKIRRFGYSDQASDEDINDFMKDKDVVDVKLSESDEDTTVMVIYKEN